MLIDIVLVIFVTFTNRVRFTHPFLFLFFPKSQLVISNCYFCRALLLLRTRWVAWFLSCPLFDVRSSQCNAFRRRHMFLLGNFSGTTTKHITWFSNYKYFEFSNFTAVEFIHDSWIAIDAVCAARAIRHLPNHLHTRRGKEKDRTAEVRWCLLSQISTSHSPVPRIMVLYVFNQSPLSLGSSTNIPFCCSHRCLGIRFRANDLLFHHNARFQEPSDIRTQFGAFDTSIIECDSWPI